MNESTVKIKSLIHDEVCMGTFGLVELELLMFEKQMEITLKLEKEIASLKEQIQHDNALQKAYQLLDGEETEGETSKAEKQMFVQGVLQTCNWIRTMLKSKAPASSPLTMKYRVKFKCYWYNTGQADNHSYINHEDFDTIEEAMSFKARVDNRDPSIEIENGFIEGDGEIVKYYPPKEAKL